MSRKQFSMLKYWDETTKSHVPQMHFNPQQSYMPWQNAAKAKLKELLGEYPQAVPLCAECEYSVMENGIIRERISFDTEEHISVPCYVLRPADMAADKTNAAIICLHGHERFAKDTMSGMRITQEHDYDIFKANLNMGERMARRGYLTICPDLRGFGERRDRYDPIDKPIRDTCNVQFMKGAILGRYTMALNLFDISRCVDYLCERKEVSQERIGALGIGLGGAYALFAAAMDERIKAVDCAGFLTPFRQSVIQRGANICGAQLIPQLWAWLDNSDVAGLLAQNSALLLEMGLFDQSFPFADMMCGYEETEKIFAAAGKENALWQDVHQGGHEFADGKITEFFNKFLKENNEVQDARAED